MTTMIIMTVRNSHGKSSPLSHCKTQVIPLSHRGHSVDPRIGTYPVALSLADTAVMTDATTPGEFHPGLSVLPFSSDGSACS